MSSVSHPTYAAEEIPSRPGADSPELAALGPFAVGYRTLTLSEPDQIDVLAFDPKTHVAPRRTRTLTVDLWYPAQPAPGSGPARASGDSTASIHYDGELPGEPPAPPSRFSTPGLAIAGAQPATAERHPLVIVSHGYSNVTAALTWLTENLASKGYVVAAIRHADPPITDPSQRAGPTMRRPLDIAFVARELRGPALRQDAVLATLAPRVALVGYSMGGYGVITAAGAELSPSGAAVQIVPGAALAPYAAGGPKAPELRVADVKAVVAISPFGGRAQTLAWGAEGLAHLKAPLLLIAGDHDETVGFDGVRAIFDAAIHAPRALLVYENAGHSIGLNPAPQQMRARLWDIDWFEDPVWRARRINAINLHFITAFLGARLRGEQHFESYLDVSTVKASDGAWPQDLTRYDAYSPGGPGLVWKGFQRRHVAGLELRRADAAP